MVIIFSIWLKKVPTTLWLERSLIFMLLNGFIEDILGWHFVVVIKQNKKVMLPYQQVWLLIIIVGLLWLLSIIIFIVIVSLVNSKQFLMIKLIVKVFKVVPMVIENTVITNIILVDTLCCAAKITGHYNL